jgi:uncharacterized protein YegP (UPF0339 family)
MADKYVIYKDDKKQYRWRYKSNNGDIIADSGESYINKSDCKRGIDIMKASRDVPVDDQSD